jgi:cobalt/nickel transport protein
LAYTKYEAGHEGRSGLSGRFFYGKISWRFFMKIIKHMCSFLASVTFLFASAMAAEAHFGMVIPSVPTVMEMPEADINVDVKFWHPFENVWMDMEKPLKFLLFNGGQAIDLLPQLKEGDLRGFKKWSAAYKTARPGLYIFAMEPAPYWEPEEDKFIIHYTKAYLSAFGDDEGWAEPVGLKTEIVPLTNPTGLYAGGLFTGQVLLDGQPVPHSAVEVEWYPGENRRGQAPTEAMITLSLVADDRGVFSFAVPAGRGGWWGFAALNDADFTLKQGGDDKAVELGGVVWVYFHEMKDAVAAE